MTLTAIQNAHAVPPRPSETDEFVIGLAVDKVLDSVMEWCEEVKDSPRRDEIRADLVVAVKEADFRDGYQIASVLEHRLHWDGCDMRLAEELDSISVRNVCEKLTAEWVANYGVYPGKPTGDPVTWRGKSGFVAEPYRATPGFYLIRIPTEGHAGKYAGYIVPWEEIDGKVNATGPQPATIDGPLFGFNQEREGGIS